MWQNMKNIWSSFDVRGETQRHAIQRRHLLNHSDFVLFENDPERTPKRTRDQKIDHALSNTPKSKTDKNNKAHGHVDVPYRQIVHELFNEATDHIDTRFRDIGLDMETLTPKTPKKWGTPLSKSQVDDMTIDDLDANHKRLQVQSNLDFATGMARKTGTRVVEQLIVEDRKRAEERALRDKWLEHRKRLKSVAQPRIEVSGRTTTKAIRGGKEEEGKDDGRRNKSVDEMQAPMGRRRRGQSRGSGHGRGSQQDSWRGTPVTMLGADESKPVYGMRKVEDIDEIIQASQTKNGKLNKSVLLDPTAVVLRCAEIRKNASDDLESLHQGLNQFLSDELEWEEKRHDIKYVLNSRFDMLKKEIDHSVSVGGADYRYDTSFTLNDEDRQALQRIKGSVKARRKKALHEAATTREETMKHMLDRRMDATRVCVFFKFFFFFFFVNHNNLRTSLRLFLLYDYLC